MLNQTGKHINKMVFPKQFMFVKYSLRLYGSESDWTSRRDKRSNLRWIRIHDAQHKKRMRRPLRHLYTNMKLTHIQKNVTSDNLNSWTRGYYLRKDIGRNLSFMAVVGEK